MIRFGKKFAYFQSSCSTVSIAGDWNNWAGSALGNLSVEEYALKKNPMGEWFFSSDELPDGRHEFKFIVDGVWEEGINRSFHVINGCFVSQKSTIQAFFVRKDLIRVLSGEIPEKWFFLPDLKIKKAETSSAFLEIELFSQADLCCDYHVFLEIGDSLFSVSVSWNTYLDSLIYDKKLGAFLQDGKSVFRLAAPRIRKVQLLLTKPEIRQEIHEMILGENGIHETVLSFDCSGYHYQYRLFKDSGTITVSDPWAFCCIFHDGPSVFCNPDPVTDGFQNPAAENSTVYEMHLRDFTVFDQSIRSDLRGKYPAFSEICRECESISHFLSIGVNAVEFLPLQEADDFPHGSYHWGYMTSFFLSPESSYATAPDRSVTEMQQMVRFFHKNGIAVIMDVVFNHTGGPGVLEKLDRSYFYRMTGNEYDNYSGCGNDLRTEAVLVRKLILDSLKHFVTFYGIDGFRFDLFGLIDPETGRIIAEEMEKMRPGIILIAEPWSSKGDIRHQLRGTFYSSWNCDFKDTARKFLSGRVSSEKLVPLIRGSTGEFALYPRQSVNYLECHDGDTLYDYLCRETSLSDSENKRLCIIGGCLLVMSLGIPMISQGQELLRSKKGSVNSYNQGDGINGIVWNSLNCDTKAVFQSLLNIRNDEKFKKLLCAQVRNHGFIRFFFDRFNSSSISYMFDPEGFSGNSLLIMLNAHSVKKAEFSELRGMNAELLCDWKNRRQGNGYLENVLPPLSFRVYGVQCVE